MTKAKIEKIAENLGWTVDWDKYSNGTKWVTLMKYSPLGQDFTVEINYKNLGEIGDKLREKYDNYDPSYETSLWLGDDGHGKNGAPYDMLVIYNDMKACEEMLCELVDAIGE